jgi:NAD(P)-dependent dehydrogenase (short-subunit alcohol dehydrogenase family)
MSAYASAKGAIDVLTRYLALELGGRGITANMVAPGPTGTDIGGGHLRDDEQVRGALAAQTALGRVGEPDDIGGAVASLLTGDNRWVTGQRIEVSGGFYL